MGGDNGQKSGLSRRDFFKLSAIAGAGLQLAGMAGAGLSSGKDFNSYTGWVDREGLNQIDRKQFELDEYPYKPVGPTRRSHRNTEVIFHRTQFLMPHLMRGWKPEQGFEKLGEPLKSYYEEHPKDAEFDYISFIKNAPKARKDGKKYGNFFKLAKAYQEGWADNYHNYPHNPTKPPEVADFQFTKHDMFGRPPRDVKLPEKAAFKSPDHAAKLVKRMAQLYGATIVGITELNPLWVYSDDVRGGKKGPFEVPKHWKYAIAMGIPQEWDQFMSNPTLGTSVDAYTRCRNASGRLTAFIKQLGYSARSHHPGNDYDLMAVAVAHDAGLGEVGRHGSIITPELGANVRLTIVTTDLPMTVDKPIDFGVKKFCKTCKICAEYCPSRSISFDETPEKLATRGWERWRIEAASCFAYWMQNIGPGGCRLCLAVCPYSRKDNWMHKISKTADINDPTGLVARGLTWMQKSFFKGPAAEEYLPPPDGRFASYRPAPEYLDVEKWFDIKVVNPQKGE